MVDIQFSSLARRKNVRHEYTECVGTASAGPFDLRHAIVGTHFWFWYAHVRGGGRSEAELESAELEPKRRRIKSETITRQDG